MPSFLLSEIDRELTRHIKLVRDLEAKLVVNKRQLAREHDQHMATKKKLDELQEAHNLLKEDHEEDIRHQRERIVELKVENAKVINENARLDKEYDHLSDEYNELKGQYDELHADAVKARWIIEDFED